MAKISCDKCPARFKCFTTGPKYMVVRRKISNVVVNKSLIEGDDSKATICYNGSFGIEGEGLTYLYINQSVAEHDAKGLTKQYGKRFSYTVERLVCELRIPYQWAI